MSLDARLQRVWYGPAWRSLPLWPLSLLFRRGRRLRASLRRAGVLPTLHASSAGRRGRQSHRGRHRQDAGGCLARAAAAAARAACRRRAARLRRHAIAVRRASSTATDDCGGESATKPCCMRGGACTWSSSVPIAWRRRRLAQAQGAEVDRLRRRPAAHCAWRATARLPSSMARAASAMAGCCPRGRCASRRARLDSVHAVVVTGRDGPPRAAARAAWAAAGRGAVCAGRGGQPVKR